MTHKNFIFMEIDKNYYQELVKKADFYRETFKENQEFKQQIDCLKQKNHFLKQKLQELEKQLK